MFLNAGAVIGTVIGAVLLLGLLAWNDWDHSRGLVRLGLLLVVLGFFGGSYVWGLAFDRDDPAPPRI